MTESTIISLSAARSLDYATFKSSSDIDEKDFRSIVDFEHPSRPNLNEDNQTQEYHFNGGTNTLDISLRPFLITPPRIVDPQEYFHVKQKWEGYVISVGQDTFLARLIRIMGEGSELEAEIYLEDVESPDRVLVEPGAVFYWSIGYFVKPSGNRIRASLIRFRRLPPWTKSELKNARAEAAKLMSLLDEG